MELWRRALLVAGLFVGLWCALMPVEAVVRVEVADVEAALRRASRDPAGAPVTSMAKAAEDRTSVGEPATWARVAGAAAAVRAGRPPEPPFDDRVGTAWGRAALYLGADDGTVRTLVPSLGPDRTFAYVRTALDGRDAWLEATWLRPAYARDVEPSRLLRPSRRLALPVFGLALALYVLLPRWKPGETTAYYGRARAVVLPDALGVLLCAVFLALPMFVIPTSPAGGGLFDGDWVALTIVMWAMAGFGLAILGVAAWYATLRFEVEPDAIRRVTLFGARTIPLASIEEVRPVTHRAPRRLVGLSLLVGLFRPALLGQALLLAGREDPGVELVLRGGERVRVLLTALEHAGALERALARVGGAPSA